MFINNIIINNQSIKGVHYRSRFGEEIDFSELSSLDFKFNYEVLTHKTNDRDHLVILDLYINSANEDDDNDEVDNELHLIVEGHYLVADEIEDENIERVKHFDSLSCLLSFLRTSLFNITSLTNEEGFNLPLIQLKNLHDDYKKRENKKSKKTKNKKNTNTD